MVGLHHIPHFFRRFESLCCADPPAGSRWARSFDQVDCHRCLELLVHLGETAVQQIIKLDENASAAGLEVADGMRACRDCGLRNVYQTQFVPLCHGCMRAKLEAVENSRSIARAVVMVDGDYYQK